MSAPMISEMVMVETKNIKPYFRNPRRNEKTIAKLVELIPKVGFNVPLVLDRDNVIVKGHARWTAAIQLKLLELPCVYTDGDADVIRLDRIADNRVSEFSDWEDELLKAELTMIGNSELDAVLAGLELTLADPAPAEITGNAGAGGTGGSKPGPLPGTDTTEYTEVTCSKCGHTMFVKKSK
jgi:ParB-like chromosome segregation protein Spo0J